MSITINDTIQLEVAGENTLILYFSNDKRLTSQIDPQVNKKVQQAAQLIRQYSSSEIIDLIPSYASILVVFNLLETDHQQLRKKLKKILQTFSSSTNKTGKLVELPAYYSLDVGVDLPRIAKQANLTVEQVISIHQAQEYQVYAIGFAPGFAYLGEVDSRIAMPRLSSPRLNVPKGAIAIADTQTAIYPALSPGGWNIIGLCPTDMFNSQVSSPMPVEVGDRVKFSQISRQEFLALGGELPTIKAGLV